MNISSEAVLEMATVGGLTIDNMYVSMLIYTAIYIILQAKIIRKRCHGIDIRGCSQQGFCYA